MTELRVIPGERTALLEGITARAFTADELEGKEIPSRPWIAKGFIPGRTVTLIGGDGGVGKSTLALQLCCACSAGLSWIGQTVTNGRALYVSAEDDRDELHRRLDQIAVHYGVGLEQFSGVKCLPLADEDALLAAAGSGRPLEPTELWQSLHRLVLDWRPAVIVLDGAADVYGGNENDRGQVRQFVRMLRSLAIEADCGVALLAHPSLHGLATGSGSSGSTAWNNSVRSRLYLSKPKDDDGGHSAGDLRTLAIKKANYAVSGAEVRLRLSGGAFVNDDGAGDSPSLDRAAADLRVERQFLEMLDAFKAQGRNVTDSTGRNFAPSEFAKDPRANGTTSRGFEAAMRRLFANEELHIEEHGPPSKRRRRLARKVGG